MAHEKLVDDRARRAEGLAADEDRVAGLRRSEAVMIDDFNHLSLLHSGDRLIIFIMVDHDQLGHRLFKEGAPGNIASILLAAEDRQFSIIVVGHERPRFIKEHVRLERRKFFYQQFTDRYAQAEQPDCFGGVRFADEHAARIGVPIDLRDRFGAASGEDDRRNVQFDRFPDVPLPITDDENRHRSFKALHHFFIGRELVGSDRQRRPDRFLIPPFYEISRNDDFKVFDEKVVDRPASQIFLENEITDLIDRYQADKACSFHDRENGLALCVFIEGDQAVDGIGGAHRDIGFDDDLGDPGSHIPLEWRRDQPESIELSSGSLIEVSAANGEIGIARIDLVFQLGIRICAADRIHIGVLVPADENLCHYPLLLPLS